MPPPLDQEVVVFDDDDGMPPLVDNLLPPMTYTFTTELSPIVYSTDTPADDLPEPPAPEMSMDSPPGTPMLGPARASHAKKRDASYIPRPPNAFILFRSSFIRAQHIPGQIEGNHSALSKIIGKCWKALSREEREVWEAKAIVALAEHRQKYPDWRFKPAAIALAKVKDGPRKRGNRKGRGQSEKEERSREKRCAKIADLLVAGKTGLDLAAAVQQFDCEEGRGRKRKDEGPSMAIAQVEDKLQESTTAVDPHGAGAPLLSLFTDLVDVKPDVRRSATNGRFKVPLTAMFKRSSSAPAPRGRTPPAEFQHVVAARRDSFSAAPPSSGRATIFESGGVARKDMASTGCGRSESREGTAHAFADSVASIQLFSPAGAAAPLALPRRADGGIGVDDVIVDGFRFAAGIFSSSPLPAFEPDLDPSSPSQSPVATPVSYGWGRQKSDASTPSSISDLVGEAYAPAPSPSSYSSLEGWAGSPLPKSASPISSPLSKVYHYVNGTDSPNPMEKAFGAAPCASYDRSWNEALGPGAVGSAHSLYAWGSEDFLSYSFPVASCRQDDF